jgi:hypothetical protein
MTGYGWFFIGFSTASIFWILYLWREIKGWCKIVDMLHKTIDSQGKSITSLEDYNIDLLKKNTMLHKGIKMLVEMVKELRGNEDNWWRG